MATKHIQEGLCSLAWQLSKGLHENVVRAVAKITTGAVFIIAPTLTRYACAYLQACGSKQH